MLNRLKRTPATTRVSAREIPVRVLGGSRDISAQNHDPANPDGAGTPDVVTEDRRKEALLKTGALQNAIFNSANFSSIATDEKGVIQIFNVGAERMLGYAAADVMNKITPADISAGSHSARRSLEPRAGNHDHSGL